AQADGCQGEVLYHYTSLAGSLLITLFEYIAPSPRYGYLPPGAYATDLEPWRPDLTRRQLAEALYYDPPTQQRKDLSYFVALCNDTPRKFEPLGGHQWVLSGGGDVHVIYVGKNPSP